MQTKRWIYSKTLWGNVIAIVALILEAQFGEVLTPETQIGILGALNIILRLITKKGLTP